MRGQDTAPIDPVLLERVLQPLERARTLPAEVYASPEVFAWEQRHELGGKSPNIVFADADFDAAVEGSCNGSFWNQGEICSAGSRVFVESSIFDDALQAMAERARRVKLGDGLAEDSTMGPLISAEQLERVERYMEIGRHEAELVVAGQRPTEDRLAGGYFAAPAIFQASNDATIAREEIFGPVMTVIPFKDPNEVVPLANDSDYGLAAAVWTRDVKKALTTARGLRAGVVWINDTQPAPVRGALGRLQTVRHRPGARRPRHRGLP